eukprot:2250157-Prorocentrum_lima.AAC.1
MDIGSPRSSFLAVATCKDVEKIVLRSDHFARRRRTSFGDVSPSFGPTMSTQRRTFYVVDPRPCQPRGNKD